MEEKAYQELLQTETNKLKLLLYIQEHGLPEEEESRTKLLTLLNSKNGYPVRYSDLIEWMPVIKDYWSLSFIEQIASEIKKPTAWEQEIRSRKDLRNEEKALILFALPL